jgi:dTDP-4-dehydrorhamnose reductase
LVFNQLGVKVRLYVFGAEGQIARSLREAAANSCDIQIRSCSRTNVDIRRADLVENAIAEFSPSIVINPAAYTAVDQAEAEPDLTFAINRDGAGIVAKAARRLGIPIVHLSTDYVFDGQKKDRYTESDAVGPQGVYGQSKLAGEQAVAAANECNVILRTSWVYSPFGNNFVRTIMRLSADRDRLRVVDDQLGCPTYAPDLADAILTIARKIGSAGWQNHFAGVTHVAGPDAVTWYVFAQRIVSMAKQMGGPEMAIDSISTADYPTAAKRPMNSRLCCDRLANIFNVRLPPLDSSLERCIKRLLGTQH